MKLDDRVALITGGGSGIGRAIAHLFAAEGARVVVTGRTGANLEETLTTMPEASARSLAIVADVANSTSVRDLFAAVDRAVGALDILVNNAGIGIEDMASFNETVTARGREASAGGPVTTPWNITQDMSDDTWRRMLSVHLDGTFFCTREAIPRMVKARRGAIINVSSTAAFAGQEGAPHYSAAKAGVLGFTRAVARELATQNIRVNALCPGFVETAMSADYSPGFKRGTMGRIPLGRWGTVEEVARAALFLASDDGSYFTGQSLSPNGGIFMT
jgi:3-oxoacyl-[acyl-carrier protein] reductase